MKAPFQRFWFFARGCVLWLAGLPAHAQNQPPVANAGTDRHASTGEIIVWGDRARGANGSAYLTIYVTNAPVQIATQPVSQTVFAGQPAAFGVAATGPAPLAFQ